jgi:5-methylcytosine-specific restriction protein A
MSSQSNWNSSDRASELPADWPRRRAETLRADNHRCVWPGRWSDRQCGMPANEVDHIKPGGDHSWRNLQSLCPSHHQRKTQQESAAARRKQLAKLKHPEPRHPGLR